MAKEWKIFIGILGLALLSIGGFQFRKYLVRRAFLQAQFEAFGEGRYLKQLDKMSLEKAGQALRMAGGQNCNDFVVFVTGRTAEEEGSPFFRIYGLDLSLKPQVLAFCSGLLNPSGEDIWESMKEINYLASRYREVRSDYQGRKDDLNNFSSLGHHKQEERDANENTRALEQFQKEDEDELKSLNEMMKSDKEQMEYLSEKMNQVAALVLMRLPADQRSVLLKALAGVPQPVSKRSIPLDISER